MGEVGKTQMSSMDAAALRADIDRLYRRILLMAVRHWRLAGSPSDMTASDMAHTAVRRALERLREKNLPNCNCEQFFNVTLHNIATNYRRSRSSKTDPTYLDENLVEAPDQARPDLVVRGEELARWLKLQAMIDGKGRIEDVVDALLVGATNNSDIAALVGCQVAEVENCMRRLRRKLKDLPEYSPYARSAGGAP